MNTVADQQRAYRAILCRIADLEDDGGAPVSIDHLKAVAVLTRDELSAINDYHAQAIRDEQQVDPAIFAAYWRSDIGVLELVQHVSDANREACWQAIGLDLLGELQDRADNAAETAYERDQGECFRGTEYAGYLAGQQAEAQRLK